MCETNLESFDPAVPDKITPHFGGGLCKSNIFPTQEGKNRVIYETCLSEVPLIIHVCKALSYGMR